MVIIPGEKDATWFAVNKSKIYIALAGVITVLGITAFLSSRKKK